MFRHANTNHVSLTAAEWLWRYLGWIGCLIAVGILILAPFSFWWLYASGDAAVERVVTAQSSGRFAMFGSGLSQDFVDYKLQLYRAVKPEIIAIGSSRVMQFRGAWFREKFLNMGGVAGNLAVLRSTLDALMACKRPKAAIIGLDFWWFMPQWEAHPEQLVAPTSGSYNYSFASLKKPWEWLLAGKITLAEFFRPLAGILGAGFAKNRYGIMAQQTNDGFGPDGSWYYTGEIVGAKPALDAGFRDTLLNVQKGIRAFYHAKAGQDSPSEKHLDVFAEIWCRLRSRGIQTYVFIPPLAGAVLAVMGREDYPHLYKLRDALLERGIDVMDFSDPRTLNAGDCEFVDGFHGGDIVYARILRAMADRWPALLAFVNMEKIDAAIRDWRGLAMMPDDRVTDMQEIDFLGLNCHKRIAAGQLSQDNFLQQKANSARREKRRE